MTATTSLSAVGERLRQLQSWVAVGWLREVDAAFAAFLASEVPDADPLLLLGAALASHQLGRGHVCLDLAALVARAGEALALPPEDARDGQEGAAGEEAASELAAVLAGIDLAQWQAALQDARLVGHGAGDQPLVLANDRLYLRRYWQHEQSVRAAIAQRLGAQDRVDPALQASVRAALDVLFPGAPQRGLDFEPDWQKIACAVALGARFSIVTGGPGTGKTTTVVKLLALLQHLALSGAQGPARRLRIRLAAPTGKAAARLTASITRALQDLPLQGLHEADVLRAAIPREVTTVHRLLGSIPGSRRFRHGAGQPLPLDVLVLDEASMVDLETMAAVMAALPPQGRLVLLGDKDQLASVEAGNVLGELCSRADDGHFLPATRDALAALSGEYIPEALLDARGQPLDQAVVKLRRSYRFDADSGIGQLADAVNRGDAARVQAIRAQPRPDLSWLDLDARDAGLRRLVLDGAAEGFAPDITRRQRGGQAGAAARAGTQRAGPVGYRHYLAAVARTPKTGASQQDVDAWAHTVLQAHAQFQLLCAVRRGPHGVDGLNRRIAGLLHAEGLTAAATGWYAGRPVMVTRNDYSTGLMNGDVGIALPVPAAGAGGQPLLRVAFAHSDGGIRWVLPSRLPEVETVFAMTVHKSQGSEFGHAALLLPAEPSRVLTRELVYTGITRARAWFTLALPAGAQAVLAFALARRTRQDHDGPLLADATHPGGAAP